MYGLKQAAAHTAFFVFFRVKKIIGVPHDYTG